MRPPLVQLILAAGITVAGATPVHALSFDHLILGKVKGGVKVDYTANLDAIDAALNDTGCRISGPPRTMLVPVTRSTTSPVPPNEDVVPSVTLNAAAEDQMFLCYVLRCPDPKIVTGGFRDRLQDHVALSLSKTSRQICVPAIPWSPPCGTAGDLKCGGSCDPDHQCMKRPEGGCACVPVPLCGANGAQCDGSNCPDGYTCAAHHTEGRCLCLPSCEASPDCNGVCSGGGMCFNGGPGNCQCIIPCGDPDSHASCDERTCVNGGTCQTAGDRCDCM